jgi:hypothetical protein
MAGAIEPARNDRMVIANGSKDLVMMVYFKKYIANAIGRCRSFIT